MAELKINVPFMSIMLGQPQGKSFAECNMAEKMTAIAPELEAFNKYMRGLPSERGGGQLSPMEMTLIRTYIAWKLTNVPQTDSNHSD